MYDDDTLTEDELDELINLAELDAVLEEALGQEYAKNDVTKDIKNIAELKLLLEDEGD